MSNTELADLPEPEPLGLQHSQKLIDIIERRLQHAPLTFAQYMQMSLYEPGLGYYMAGAQKFGSHGDFVTAPEVSSLFGECIAVQCREVLSSIGGSVLELGAGSGALASAVLTALSDAPPDQYLILEPSAELQYRQRDRLAATLSAELFARVVWLDALPTNFVGICIANEVMDALPVEIFSKQDNQVLQLHVSRANNKFESIPRAANAQLAEAVASIESELGALFADGYESEICLLLSPWIKSLAESITKGVVLLCDYGYPRQEYYMPERIGGTLACYYRHRFHTDPYFHPGLQDITAHVDFTRVVESASEAGLALLGYTSQSSFLINSGISTIAASKMASCQSEREQLTLSSEIKTLTLPGEMGERFQFMGLGKKFASPLLGFSQQDLSHRL